ncbi:MAG: PKD domain-containing protein [Oscillochloridaceae bacterium umkhey_bin13]
MVRLPARLIMALLVLLALLAPFSQPTAAQQANEILVLCYLPSGSNTPQDCDNLAQAGKQQDPPWNVRIVSGVEIGRILDLSPFRMMVIGRFSADTFPRNELPRVIDYANGGGNLLLLDPDVGGLLDPSLAAPRAGSRVQRPTELTRAGRFTPGIGDLAPANLPAETFSIVPLRTLGEAWIPQTRAGFGETSSTTLASALLGNGRIVLAPGGLVNAIQAAEIGKWACCIVLTFGPNMSVDAIEVTQAIQDLNNGVDLVAGKRTYVRVHVSSPEARSGVTATLSARRGGDSLGPAITPINPGGTITVKPNPNRALINDSFLFELPSNWHNTTGNLELTARLDPGNTVGDPTLSNNIRTVTVNLRSGPNMRLRIYNVRYTVGQTTYQTSNFHLNALESWLRRAYPIATLSSSRRTYTYPNAGLPNVDTLNSRLSIIWFLDRIFGGMRGDTLFYGIVDDGGGFMRGKALGIPGRVSSGPTGTPGGSWTWDTDGSYGDWYGGHEIAHSLGRFHAEFCGAGGGESFPYANGRISPSLTGNTAIYGFDITNRVIYPPDWRDVMTYCNNQWVSDFTYEGIRQRFVTIGSASLAEAELQQGSFVLIGGQVLLEAQTGQLDEIFVFDSGGFDSTIPSDEWSLVLLNGTNVLASYPFTPAPVEDDDDPARPAIFSELVPWVDGTTRIELRHDDTVLDERLVSTNPPTVEINAPTGGSLDGATTTVRWTGSDIDGDDLRYTVLYSSNNGESWRTLASNLDANELTLDTANLPGGTQNKFRVLVSDGVLTDQIDSLTFSVPTKTPEVTFIGPEDGAVFFPTQPVVLEATAYDLEDGELEGEAITWMSDRPDGNLGSGNVLNTSSLSTGVHQITVTATDSDGQTSSATRTITIAEGTTPLPTRLSLSRDVISMQEPLGSPAQVFTVNTAVIGDSTATLNWTATVTEPWVRVQAIDAIPDAIADNSPGATASGTTLQNLLVTLDPSGLGLGSYNTTLRVTSGDQTIDIPVNLNIDGERVFLPLIRR